MFKLRDALQTLEGHTDYVHALCLDAEENYLFSGGSGKKIIMWNLETYEMVKTFNGDAGQVKSIIAMRNGFLLSGGWRSVQKWNIESGKCVRTPLSGLTR